MTLRNPSESEVRHEPLIQPIVSTQSRSVARRGGKTGGRLIKDRTLARCGRKSGFESQPLGSAEVFYAECPADDRENGVSENGGDIDPTVGAVKRRVQVRPCTAPGSTPGHVFPSTLEGGLADACRQRLRTPLVSAPSRTQDSRRSRDRRGLQVKSRLKCIADPGGRPTLRPLGILNTEVHQCSFCPGRKTNRS